MLRCGQVRAAVWGWDVWWSRSQGAAFVLLWGRWSEGLLLEAELTFASHVGGQIKIQDSVRENTPVHVALKKKRLMQLMPCFWFQDRPEFSEVVSSLEECLCNVEVCKLQSLCFTQTFYKVVMFSYFFPGMCHSWCLQLQATAAAPCRPPPPRTVCSGEEDRAGATWPPCALVLSWSTLSTRAPTPSGLRGRTLKYLLRREDQEVENDHGNTHRVLQHWLKQFGLFFKTKTCCAWVLMSHTWKKSNIFKKNQC